MRPAILLAGLSACLVAADRAPLAINFQDSAAYRWLNKKVLKSRLLDDMSSVKTWTPFTKGQPGLIDARATAKEVKASRMLAEISLTNENSRDGKPSLRLRAPTRIDEPGPKSGRGWGITGVVRRFDGEDWRGFNRISVWIRPECPGAYVATLEAIRIYNDGVEKLPALFGQEGETNLVLRNHEWNHVVWEIENVARDKVTALEFSYGLNGNEPEAADTAIFDFNRLELESVDADYIEGWAVWPGRISFSHTGYQTGARKTAIASGLDAREFRLIDQQSGEAVLAKPIETLKTHLGTFQVMDFSEVRRPGSFALSAGGITTRPFRIDSNIWRETIWKALNFFYAERCGMAIPGMHGVCHRDWTMAHGDKRIVINGGWHDAGDLTQGMFGTAEITYSLFNLTERLEARNEDPELYERLIEEGQWGLEWILKTSFGDGYRDAGSANSRKTNGILGDFDDITVEASRNPELNFLAATAEALASRVLRDRDPRIAAYARKMAEADWRFAVEGLAAAPPPGTERYRGSFDSANVAHEPAALGVRASIELWKATGEQRYADKAVDLARVIVDSQQRTRLDWTTLTGFFYTSPAKDRILHYVHNSREQMPVLALTALCETLPNHPDWMKWYSAVAMYAEYLKAAAQYTEPYGMLTASIYRDNEYLDAPESRRESFRKQVLNGVPLGAGHYLRLFPVWMDYRGNNGTVLSQTQALAKAAHLRGDSDAAQLSEQQLQWVIGRNPFSESTMWGQGYDYPPLYSPMSGDIVGAIPVGIQTRGDRDVPYWPVQNTWTYKEVWQNPVARWIYLMRDLAGPALVEGLADSPVEFTAAVPGEKTGVVPEGATGRYRIMLPEGVYAVSSAGQRISRTFLPGATYFVDLRAGRALEFQVAQEQSGAGEVTLRVTARGTGDHRFALRADNLAVSGPEKEIGLTTGHAGSLEWRARIVSADAPWFAVVVPDGDISSRKELTGAAWKR